MNECKKSAPPAGAFASREDADNLYYTRAGSEDMHATALGAARTAAVDEIGQMPSGEHSGEREFVEQLRAMLAPTARDDCAVPFGDDMAAVGPNFPELLWTTDLIAEGVDFRRGEWPWAMAGRKALAVNLSDCAAMGATPVSALCALCLSDDLSASDAMRIMLGAKDLAEQFACPIVGGDTNRWPGPTVIAFTVAARIEPGGQALRRSTARPGDVLCVTGPVGGSILGRHLAFCPRVAEGRALRLELPRQPGGHAPTAMIDVSDGLAIDLHRILDASGVGAIVDAALLDSVIHEDVQEVAAQSGRSPREHALGDGEDFELLVTLPPTVELRAPPAPAWDSPNAPMLYRLGVITAERTALIREADGRLTPLAPLGWDHLA